MEQEHLFFVTYDIRCPRRWRRVYKLMRGYGEWLQLSVFQCRLDRMSFLRLEADLNDRINHAEDCVLVVDMGPAALVEPKVKCLGNMDYEPVERRATIV
jgi:CRISPR-associated protein Cas2